MNFFLDVFADDVTDSNDIALVNMRRLQEQDRSGPCEDDYEVTTPFVDILPEESEHEDGSPLDFGGNGNGGNIGFRLVRR